MKQQAPTQAATQPRPVDTSRLGLHKKNNNGRTHKAQAAPKQASARSQAHDVLIGRSQHCQAYWPSSNKEVQPQPPHDARRQQPAANASQSSLLSEKEKNKGEVAATAATVATTAAVSNVVSHSNHQPATQVVLIGEKRK